MRLTCLKTGLLAAAVLCALPVSAQVYEWRDAQGKTHYSDRPPPGVDAKQVRRGAGGAAKQQMPQPAAATPSSTDSGAEAPATPAADNAPPTLAEKELAFRERRAQAAEEKAKAEETQAKNEERKRICDANQNQLKLLQSGRRVARATTSGGREFLDEQNRAAEIERTQRFIDQNCGE